MTNTYNTFIRKEFTAWQREMLRKPSLFNGLSKRIQTKINNWIPEKIHVAVTATIKQLIKAVLFGAKHTTAHPLLDKSLQERELAIEKKIETYKKTAAVEGGIAGAGGILLGLADFPVLIGIKMKLLFDIASLYGFDVNDYKERVYLLHIFELAFSSHAHRKTIYLKMTDWETKKQQLPDDINQFDWRNFQQEYRDYIDLAKMAQLIPLIGAPVGLVVNYRLLKKLGSTAMNAYRMRLLND
ncbi:EcsC family protein [Lacibacter sp. H407]|uniref:EcsC family protein n=1 Tax=Lacibacter sp. H407 TaxID=3133423 RepID=UPI0030BF4EE2